LTTSDGPLYQFDTDFQSYIRTYTSGPVVIEETNWSTAILGAPDTDEITVTAVVPPIFQITFPEDNVDDFGNLDPGAVISTTGEPVQFATNAKSGWIAWAKSANQGLTSLTAGYTIPTSGAIDAAPTTLVAGAEGYALDVDINGGAVMDDGNPLCDNSPGDATLVIDPEYNGVGANQGGTLSANFQPIATCAGTTPPNTSAGDIVDLVSRATISFGTPAATDYTDIITVVGAGNF
jgi:hypothetical protein